MSVSGSTAIPVEENKRTVYAWYVVGVLIITSVIAYLDRLIITFLVEPIKADLQITDTQIGLLTGLAFAVFYVLMGLPLGKLVDTRDRSRILSSCIALWSAMTTFCGFALNYLMLFFARVGVGIGEAALNPAAISLIGDLFPKEKVARPIAFFTIGIYAGGGLAILLGGYLIDYFASMGAISIAGFDNVAGWRLVFVAVGVPGLLIATMLFLTVRDPVRNGVAVFKRNTQRVQKTDNEGVFKEVYRYLLANKTLYGLMFGGFIAHGFYVYGLQAWFPAMLMRTYGMSPSDVALGYGVVYLVFGVLGALAVGPCVSYLQSRGHQDAPIRFPLYCLYLMLIPSIAGPLMPNEVLCLAAFGITIFCFACIISVSLTALVVITPSNIRGTMTAVFLSLMNIIGGAFGAVFVGLLSDYVFGPEWVSYSEVVNAALLLPLAILLLIRVRPLFLEKVSMGVD